MRDTHNYTVPALRLSLYSDLVMECNEVNKDGKSFRLSLLHVIFRLPGFLWKSEGKVSKL